MVLESLLTPRGASADTIWRLWTKRWYMNHNKCVDMYNVYVTILYYKIA